MRAIVIILVCTLQNGLLCYAQQTLYSDSTLRFDFVPGDKVIFRDNFRNDGPGHFPSRWHLDPCNSATELNDPEEYFWQIQKRNDTTCLVCNEMRKYLEPNMSSREYLPDSFMIEFDFILGNSHACPELFITPQMLNKNDTCYKVTFHMQHGSIDLESGHLSSSRPELERNYPSAFNYQGWHHFILLYRGKHIYGYLDHYLLLSKSDCKFIPLRFSLGCLGPVRYKNVSVTANHVTSNFN